MNRLLKISGIAVTVCITGWSWSDAQAGGRRYARTCQPNYIASAPTTNGAALPTDGRLRYQSAYQAAPPQQNYYHNTPTARYRSGENLWDKQVNDALRIKSR